MSGSIRLWCNSGCPRPVQWSLGAAEDGGGHAEEHGRPVCRTALRPEGDHPLRRFNSFDGAMTEKAEARILGGIHFRTSCCVARVQGTAVANYLLRHSFRSSARMRVVRAKWDGKAWACFCVRAPSSGERLQLPLFRLLRRNAVAALYRHVQLVHAPAP